MNLTYIKTIFTLLFGRKKQLFLTVSGITLPLLLYISVWEGMNSFSASSYRNLRSFDSSGILIQAENAIDLSDFIHALNDEGIPCSHTTLCTTDFHLDEHIVCQGKPVQINLDTSLLSGKINGGYLPYNAMDTLWESKITLLYTQPEPAADKIASSRESDSSVKSASEYSSDSSVIPCILERSTSMLLFAQENSIGNYFSFPQEQGELIFRVCAIIEDLPETREKNLQFNRDIHFSRNDDPIYTSRALYIPARCRSLLPDTQTAKAESFSCSSIHFSEETLPQGLSIAQKTDFHAGYTTITDYQTTLLQTQEQIRMIQLLFIPFFFLLMIIDGLMIMNTMFFSVQERTKEIGIRKAVGAGTKKIILQFLFEGSIIGIISATISCILSTLTLQVLTFIMLRIVGRDLTFSLHPQTILTVYALSTALTLLFSILPALHAAQTDPSITFLT